DGPFHRCRHCFGFYEVDRDRCKWCDYAAPMLDVTGKPIAYPSRPAIRQVLLGEYERLPAAAREDHMAPPPNNLLLRCGCIHCGQDGSEFEAIEMRWLATEGMWACPCTTCGGRGFHLDIHPLDPVWECAECGHWYTPEKFTSKYAHCPV